MPLATQDAAQPLRDAVHRAMRGRQAGWVVLVFYLTRLAPPAPKPHHRRIARVVLDDEASRREGQLFTLATGDLALLFPASDGGASLAKTLQHLFAPDATDTTMLVSRWQLPSETEALSAFLDALPSMAIDHGIAEQQTALAAVTRVFNSIDPASIRDLLERQVGVLVKSNGKDRVRPLFRELRFSLPALETRAALFGPASHDPFLFRHLTAKFERAMLAAVKSDLENNRPVVAGVRDYSALHIKMSVETVLSAEFATLADSARGAGIVITVEIALLEAFADMPAFLLAQSRVREAGFSLLLDEVTHHALQVTQLAALSPDLLKLEWSPQLPQTGASLDRAIAVFRAEQIIMYRVDTEAAVRWGMARGIRRFQGRYIDAMLGALRLAGCSESGRCTLRQCIDRSASTTQRGRVECGNLPLLDAAAPAVAEAS